MEPVTHVVSGVLAERALRRWLPRARYLLPFCLLMALLPDADNFIGRDLEQYLRLHRGITHSLLGIVLLPVFGAALYRAFSKDLSWRAAWLIGAGITAMHVFLDLITSYGTQVLAPFSSFRAGLGSVFIVDPLYTGVMLLLALTALFWKRQRVRLGTAGLAFLLAYPLATFGAKTALEHHLAAELARQGESFASVAVTAEPFTPFFWKVVTDAGEDWTVRSVDILGRPQGEATAYPKADRDLLRKLGRDSRLLATWEWFSVYPFILEKGRDCLAPGAACSLLVGDLRFVVTNPFTRSIIDRSPPFTLQLRIGPDGRLSGLERF